MAKSDNPFRWFDSSPEVIRTVVMMYVRFPLSLRQVENILAERGIDICHETVRLGWNRFGPMFASEIRRKRIQAMRSFTHWRWRLDEVCVKINGERPTSGAPSIMKARSWNPSAPRRATRLQR